MSTLLYGMFCLFSFLPNGEGDFHEFHLSKSEVKVVRADQQIQISIHVFIDDLELALLDMGAENLGIGTEDETELSDGYIAKYLSQKLTIDQDGTTLQSQFIGKELSEDLMAIWCYFEVVNVSDCTDLTITNTILTEKYDDQKNIISFTSDEGAKDYFIFDVYDREKIFSCN